jgi:hypothetical protein
MRAVTLVAILLLGAGCTAPNELFGRDGGGAIDLAVVAPADLRGVPPTRDLAQALSCDDIAALVAANLANSTSCTVDTDCVTVETACGLPGACGDAYANTGWRTDDVERLLKGWAAAMCGPPKCPCPEKPSQPPACNRGVCGPRHSTGTVGAACTSALDCATSQCITEGEDKLFAGGYCTLRGCSDFVPCPAGSTCRGVSNGLRVCLADCKAATDCRTGYGCCSGPGPGRDAGWCAPTRSSLCLAL